MMDNWKEKHNERDLNLPPQREKLLMAIKEDVLNDDNILAIFYGGSIGNESTDLYSDIDLRLVVKATEFEAYRSSRKQRAQQWGNILFFEDFPWSNTSPYVGAHYNTFIMVDIFYYKLEEIQPSIWLQDIKILKDSTGRLKEVVKQSKRLTYFVTEQEVEAWRAKFFAHLHEIYRRLKRGENYYALHSLDTLRSLMVAAWYMEAGIQPNTLGDWGRLEGRRSQLTVIQRKLLEEWDSTRDSNTIWHGVKKIIPEFLDVHARLCTKLNIEENREWIEEIINLVL